MMNLPFIADAFVTDFDSSLASCREVHMLQVITYSQIDIIPIVKSTTKQILVWYNYLILL